MTTRIPSRCFEQPNIDRITLWVVLLILRQRANEYYDLYGGTTKNTATAPSNSSSRWNDALGWMLKYWRRVKRFMRKQKQKGRSAGVGKHEIGRGRRWQCEIQINQSRKAAQATRNDIVKRFNYLDKHRPPLISHHPCSNSSHPPT